MKKIELLLLLLIISLGFVVRMYRFDRPIADWHSWRQSDTSMVSRNFIKEEFDIFRPRFDDLSKGVSLIDNPKGYRFVEFPFYNLAQAGIFKIQNRFTIEESGRIVTVFSSLISILLLYLLVKKYISARAGLAAAFFYAFVPYSIYYGRTVLPDTSMVTFLLLSIYTFDKWLEKNSNMYFVLATILFSITVLFKPFALFYILPFLYLAYKKFGLALIFEKKIWIFAVLSLIPFMLWRFWMSQYPEGIPRNNWLYNSNNIRFKGAFFHWLFAERISKIILGYFGLPFVVLGMVAKVKKEGFLFFSFLISSLAYLTVFATGNVTHDYYQILIVPTIALFFAKGVDLILDVKQIFSRFISYLVITSSIIFMLAFGWFVIRDYYNLQHIEIVQAGVAADKILPKNAKVIAPYSGDTTFLYHVNRKGWPVWDRPLGEFLREGATHMVFVNPGEGELKFKEFFTVLGQTESYIIFDLTNPLKPFKE